MATLQPSARKSVQWGAPLSPELYHVDLPPATPVKLGEMPQGSVRKVLPVKVCATGSVHGAMLLMSIRHDDDSLLCAGPGRQ
jgi:hypothetical protein